MNMVKVAVQILVILGLAFVASACSSWSTGMSGTLDLEDVDRALDELMKNFVASSFVDKIKANESEAAMERPALAVDKIVNETNKHNINPERLLLSFETRLMNLNMFNVVESQKGRAKIKSLLKEQDTFDYNEDTIPEAGNLLGFKYVIGGKLFGHTERTGSEIRHQYRLILTVVDIETGLKEWQDDVDVTKHKR